MMMMVHLSVAVVGNDYRDKISFVEHCAMHIALLNDIVIPIMLNNIQTIIINH